LETREERKEKTERYAGEKNPRKRLPSILPGLWGRRPRRGGAKILNRPESGANTLPARSLIRGENRDPVDVPDISPQHSFIRYDSIITIYHGSKENSRFFTKKRKKSPIT
jgi:hypothetical protein